MSRLRQSSDSVWPLKNSEGLTFAEAAKRAKLARYAHAYGAGDVKVGLITGKYPNGHT